MSTLITIVACIAVILLLIKIVASVTTAIKIRSQGRQKLSEQEHQKYAKEILADSETLPVTKVVELANEVSDQYDLLDKYPKAWASAVIGGYIEDLVLELDYFTTWASRTTRSNPSQWEMTLDELREKDRCAYLQHLDLWRRDVIASRLTSEDEIQERIEKEAREKKYKLARAVNNIEEDHS